MDIDQLATLLQRELECLRDEMTTREELKAVEGKILRAIDGLSSELSRYTARWNGDFERLSDRIHDIDHRFDAGTRPP